MPESLDRLIVQALLESHRDRIDMQLLMKTLLKKHGRDKARNILGRFLDYIDEDDGE